MHFTVRYGRTWTFEFGPFTRAGAGVVLIGAEGKFVIKRNLNQRDADTDLIVTEVPSTRGAVTFDVDSHTAIAVINPLASKLTPGEYEWEFILKESDGTITSDQTHGTLTVEQVVGRNV